MALLSLKKGLRFAIIPVSASLAFVSHTSSALDFSLGEIDGQFDSNISMGASWRLNEFKSQNVASGNASNGLASSSTNDDGTLNFENDKTFSKTFKGVHDLQLSYKQSGLFTRFNYWYDKELKDEFRQHGHGPNDYTSGKLNDDDFSDRSTFSGFGVLDAFLYTSFDIADKPVDLRLGKQVVNWGESTFIQNSINAFNPIQVSAFRRAGAEIKEALLPVNMLFGSIALTENLSLEAFYQLEWEKTEIDPCGTFFSTSDVAAEGCNTLTLSNAFPDSVLASMPIPSGTGSLLRTQNREPDDDGQFGISVKLYAPELNDTEFGFYYLNYHIHIGLYKRRQLYY